MNHFKYKYDELFNPVLQALHQLGGSGSITEIEDEVAKILNLTEDEIDEIHRGNTTKLSYRLAWARNYLKRYGLLENSSRGVWALTTKGYQTREVDNKEVNKFVKSIAGKSLPSKDKEPEEELRNDNENIEWQEQLLNVLYNISPSGFERLCQRLLREIGFANVVVTGKTGDGGIDGKGVIKLANTLSFHVVFQCKRYKGSVTASQIRDFRGAMIGRAEKGLYITTGNFTKDARKEAQREGASPLDLIDGNQLAIKLKELELGVKVIELIEKVEVNEEWFEEFD